MNLLNPCKFLFLTKCCFLNRMMVSLLAKRQRTRKKAPVTCRSAHLPIGEIGVYAPVSFVEALAPIQELEIVFLQ